ncbi:MAG TPA: nitroreductase [Solirubrobacterales bacterium]|jgi:nitroreductase|nr:nitroreductase [Solirubrobacterales bacterium]
MAATMDVETAIRTRRTHKAFGSEPLDRGTLAELFELANWAPNHHLTVPWRFRVVGPASLQRLKQAAGPEGAAKLDRCPTLVVVSSRLDPEDPVQSEEDLHATAVASYIVLLAAHARGLAGYWRTPGLLREEGGRAAVGVPAGERILGLLHLGHPRQERPVPERPQPEPTVLFLD